MSANDQIILGTILDQKRAELAPTLPPSAFFEVFVAEQVLKDYDLSYDELHTGAVGEGGDGGIDGLYVFVNGDLVQEDTDFGPLKKDVLLELVIIQAKTSPTFNEAALDKLIAVTEDLLDLSHSLSDYKTVTTKRFAPRLDCSGEPMKPLPRAFRNSAFATSMPLGA